jgi:hypothetical protein
VNSGLTNGTNKNPPQCRRDYKLWKFDYCWINKQKAINKPELTNEIWLYQIWFVPLQPVRAFFGLVRSV